MQWYFRRCVLCKLSESKHCESFTVFAIRHLLSRMDKKKWAVAQLLVTSLLTTGANRRPCHQSSQNIDIDRAKFYGVKAEIQRYKTNQYTLCVSFVELPHWSPVERIAGSVTTGHGLRTSPCTAVSMVRPSCWERNGLAVSARQPALGLVYTLHSKRPSVSCDSSFFLQKFPSVWKSN